MNEPFDQLDVWLGKSDKIDVHIDQDLYKTIKKARKKDLKAIIEYDGPIKAPIVKDQEVGLLKIYFKDELIDEFKVYACLLYTSPSPRDQRGSRMPSSA